MMLPVQITSRNIEERAEAERWIQEEAHKLDRYNGRITSCRVLMEVQHTHRKWGWTYHVRVDIGLPGKEIVVKHDPSLRAPTRWALDKRLAKRLPREQPRKDLHRAIQETFKAARRRVQEYARRQRGDVKWHEPEPHGRVLRTFAEREFGFLEGPDGREVYFHRNAVVGENLERMPVGTRVAFHEEPGEKGPHATVVKLR